MTVRDYAEGVVESIKERYPDMVNDVKMRVTEFTKPGQGSLTGISFVKEGSIIGPTYYVNSDFEEGVSVGDAAERIAIGLPAALDSVPTSLGEHVANIMTNYDMVKDKIFITAYDSKEGSIPDAVIHRAEGLNGYYKVVLNENASSRVTKDLLDTWGVTEQELFRQAMKNSLATRTPQLRDIMDVVLAPDELNAISSDTKMIVCTEVTADKNAVLFGAGYIFNRDFLAEVAETIDSSFYVLPSSVHEVLFVPEPIIGGLSAANVNALATMVKEVNATLNEGDYLSSDVYFFDKDKSLFLDAEKAALGFYTPSMIENIKEEQGKEMQAVKEARLELANEVRAEKKPKTR